MRFDDVIIGSGLSALAVASVLAPAGRKILVIGRSRRGAFAHYPGSTMPASYSGFGGLGNFWHGVIPLGLHVLPENVSPESFYQALDEWFPDNDLRKFVGQDYLFVPKRPLRPKRLWPQLTNVVFLKDEATRLSIRGSSISVETLLGSVSAGRAWLAAGALETPTLLQNSRILADKERTVSDHVIGYVGQISEGPDSRELSGEIRRLRQGVLFPCRYDPAILALYTIRPAMFDFAPLDRGFEKRAVFGLPVSKAAAAIARRMSPGLMTEALFNKTGRSLNAAQYSVYLQTLVSDAYTLSRGRLDVGNPSAFQESLRAARAIPPFMALRPSQRPDLYLPGIHLHGSILPAEVDQVEREGKCRIHIADASRLRAIGPEHHSFKLMVAAREQAKRTL